MESVRIVRTNELQSNRHAFSIYMPKLPTYVASAGQPCWDEGALPDMQYGCRDSRSDSIRAEVAEPRTGN
jgi:hypothetical protein